MAFIPRYIAVACQFRSENRGLTWAGVRKNLDKMEDFVGWAYEQFSYSFPVKLMGFPEYSMSGYAARNIKEARKVAERIPGESTDVVGDIAKKYKIFIQPGSLSEDKPGFEKTIFDAAPLVSPEGKVLMTYRKTNPWLPDEFWPSPHDFLDMWDFKKDPLFPVAKTDIGNLGIYICNDAMTPETARQLAFNGAEVLIHPTLLMDPWIIPPLNYYEMQCRWNSVVNMVYGLNSNGAWEPGNAPPYPMQGGSNVTDYEGRTLSACPAATSEAYCFGNIDIGALRAYRLTMMTHNGLGVFKKEMYDYFRRGITYPSNPLIREDINWDVPKSRKAVRKAYDRFYADYYKDSVRDLTLENFYKQYEEAIKIRAK